MKEDQIVRLFVDNLTLLQKLNILNWVLAGESGKFKQGFNSLLCEVTDNGEECYCYLGIAAQILPDVWIESTTAKHEGEEVPCKSFNGNVAFVESSILSAYGLRDGIGSHGVIRQGVYYGESLSSYNDNPDHRMSFQELSAYIRKAFKHHTGEDLYNIHLNG